MPRKEDKFFADMLKPVKNNRRRYPPQELSVVGGPSGPSFSNNGPSGPTMNPVKKRRVNR